MNEKPTKEHRSKKRRMGYVIPALFTFLTLLCLNCEPTTTTGPGAQPEVTDVGLDPSLVSSGYPNFLEPDAYNVPHDASNSLQKTLAIFAWQEFIALNWPSSYNTQSHERGQPDTTKTVLDFLNFSPDQPLVWETYMHRVEVYPDTLLSSYDTLFNRAPSYVYNVPGQQTIQRLDSASAPPLSQVSTIFNNLDEVTEIDLCTMFILGDSLAPGGSQANAGLIASGFPGAPRRVIYEAKANEDMFKYVVRRKLYEPSIRTSLIAYTKDKISNLSPSDTLGGLYPCGDNHMICFPHGVDTTATVGSIEIKAAWRQLTMEEYESGRFVTSEILSYRKQVTAPGDTVYFYQTVPATPTANSLPYGLVGLHIIHKTANFPTYVFATFEQVDILNQSVRANIPFYYNRDSNNVVSPEVQFVTERTPPIKSTTADVTNEVHNQMRAMNSNTPWQFYRLVGVQGPASNDQDTTDFFLSNLLVETNTVLSTFSGTLDTNNGTKDPRKSNIHQGSNLIIGGGCKGCHGNAQQSDFSFITQNAPFDGVPDVVNQALRKGRAAVYVNN